MCFFRKKPVDRVKDNRELISSNEKAVESLIILANKNEALARELRQLREKIKYLAPSSDNKTVEYDKKIKNLIEDLRTVLTKTAEEEIPQKADALITQIRLLISDRNTKI